MNTNEFVKMNTSERILHLLEQSPKFYTTRKEILVNFSVMPLPLRPSEKLEQEIDAAIDELLEMELIEYGKFCSRIFLTWKAVVSK